ncbi:ABC transporter permease [bacterium 210917-DFI.7.65]|nr:ABC transporter permease [Clostridiales bacterium]MCB6900351.1 ABC transporter permease [bacterium 210917-DFI.7.65]
MNLAQAFKMAVKSIWSKKMRSLLTMLGIIIGIAAVMIIVSVITGANKKSMEYYESMGTNKISVSAQLYSGGDAFEEVYNYCKSIDMVVGVTPTGYVGGTVKYGAKNSQSMEYPPQIYLGSDQYSMCNNFQIDKGRDLSYLDVKKYSAVCVLGAAAAKNFFDAADPIGKDLTIAGANFTVVGVYAQKDFMNQGYSLDNVIVIPYTSQRYLSEYSDLSDITVKVKDSASVNQVIALLNGNFDNWNQTGRGNFWCYSDQSWQDQSNQQALMMSLVLGAIAGISLLVGGIGIMNIMLVTVTERTREIGIRRAIGAERKSIVIQFLIEAGVICGIGGIIGIAIGFFGTAIASKLIVQSVLLPSPVITIFAFLFSVALGVLFGMFPAIKASKLQPVVALRAE